MLGDDEEKSVKSGESSDGTGNPKEEKEEVGFAFSFFKNQKHVYVHTPLGQNRGEVQVDLGHSSGKEAQEGR